MSPGHGSSRYTEIDRFVGYTILRSIRVKTLIIARTFLQLDVNVASMLLDEIEKHVDTSSTTGT